MSKVKIVFEIRDNDCCGNEIDTEQILTEVLQEIVDYWDVSSIKEVKYNDKDVKIDFEDVPVMHQRIAIEIE